MFHRNTLNGNRHSKDNIRKAVEHFYANEPSEMNYIEEMVNEVEEERE